MAFNRLRTFWLVAAGLVVVLGLAGCGRKAGLDPPPSAALPPAPAAGTPATAAPSPLPPGSTAATSPPPEERTPGTGFDSRGNPVAAAGEHKPFILDFLLK